jgi:hypothetical protein
LAQNQEKLPPLAEDWAKDLLYRNVATFISAKQVAEMLVHVQKGTPQPNDFKLRDLIFTRRLAEERENPSLFNRAEENFYISQTLNSRIKYEQLT